MVGTYTESCCCSPRPGDIHPGLTDTNLREGTRSLRTYPEANRLGEYGPGSESTW